MKTNFAIMTYEGFKLKAVSDKSIRLPTFLQLAEGTTKEQALARLQKKQQNEPNSKHKLIEYSAAENFDDVRRIETRKVGIVGFTKLKGDE